MKKLLLMIALVLGVFALSQRSEAQHNNGHYDRDYVTCESNSYSYRECGSYYIRRIDTVRLVQQHSKTACRYRQNWGANPWMIWVDNGCRATFEVRGWTK